MRVLSYTTPGYRESIGNSKSECKAMHSAQQENTSNKIGKGGQDRLSNLPDEVLCHILSFLGTEGACRTSILSRRWRFLWATDPNVSFFFCPNYFLLQSHQEETQHFARFNHWVNKVLDSRNKAHDTRIRKFDLECSASHGLKPNHVIKWINGAIQCHVEELYLKVALNRVDDKINVPLTLLLSSKTIISLKLHGKFSFDFEAMSGFSSSACLPSLKVLSLNTPYKCDDFVPRLVSCCPALEEFHISGFYQVLKMRALRLKKFVAKFGCGLFGEAKEFEIDAPSLEYLSLRDFCTSKYSVKNLDNVVEAELRALVDWKHRSCIFKLLKGLSNVKHLSLYIDYTDHQEYDTCANQGLLVFHNLVHLHFGKPFVTGLLPIFLQKSPKLEDLVVEAPYKEFKTKLEVPECLSSHLTKFTYKGFRGRKTEFEYVGYILKNSSVLQKMTIQPAIWLKDRSGIYKKLDKLPRGSKSCKIEFK